MLHRLRVAIPVLFFLDVVVPTSAYAQQVRYGLEAGSILQWGCFPTCLCSVFVTDKLQGTFALEFIGSDGTFDEYAVSDVQLIVVKADEVFPIGGSGTYRIGGEPVLQ